MVQTNLKNFDFCWIDMHRSRLPSGIFISKRSAHEDVGLRSVDIHNIMRPDVLEAADCPETHLNR